MNSSTKQEIIVLFAALHRIIDDMGGELRCFYQLRLYRCQSFPHDYMKEGKMPKDRFSLSKKHEYLIDKITKMPTINDIQNAAWSNDDLYGKRIDFRYNTEDVLLMIIENLTKGTQMEEIGKEISEKARAVFDYYADK